MPARERVDDDLGFGSGELDEAQLRPERLLAHELRVDRHEVGGGEYGAERRQVRRLS